MTVMANCGHDGRGQYRGDVAGDQTGDEWCLCDWVYYGQNVILRHPLMNVRDMIASFAEMSAANDNIGYDQSERTTFWLNLVSAGYRPDAISEPCEADCSSGVAAIVKAIGFIIGDEAMASVSPWMTTYDEVYWLTNAGFVALYDDAYTLIPDNLVRGDIVCNENMHTNIVIEGAGEADELDEDIVYMQKKLNVFLNRRGWPMIVPNGQYDWRTEVPLIKLVQDWMTCCKDPTVDVDANFYQGFINALKLHPISRGMANIAVFAVKAALIGKGYKNACLNVEDWNFTSELEYLVKQYQGEHWLKEDGRVDSDTLFSLTH